MPAQLSGLYSRIYECVEKIPAGRVATYGQIAALVNASGARQVGYALSATPAEIEIPWHRVINAKGEISQRSGSDTAGDSEQKSRLLAEGIAANQSGRIDLERYRWNPDLDTLYDQPSFDEAAWRDRPGFG